MKFQIGIVGAGVIGRRLASRFANDKEVHIKWICDLALERASLLAEEFGGIATTDLNDILNDKEIDVMYVGVPPKWHPEITVSALAKGKHVICEKPIALTIAEADRMIDMANNSGLKTCINLPFRWTPAVIAMNEKLKASYVGEIKRILLKFRFPQWPREWQQVDWLAQAEQGGPLREVGTHFFFALYELKEHIGLPVKVQVETQFHPHGGCERYAKGIIELDSGLVVDIDLVTGGENEEENSITVLGEKGILTLQSWYRLLGKTGNSLTLDTIYPLAKLEVLNEQGSGSEDLVGTFIKHLKGEASDRAMVSFEEARFAQNILESIFASKGKLISL